MNKNDETKSNVIQGNFALCDQPIAYQISVVMNNMYATYGVDTVKHVLKELYNIDLTAHIGQDKASNE